MATTKTTVQAEATLLTNVGNGRQNAFYNIYMVGMRVITHHGAQGRDGQSNVKAFLSPSEARHEYEKIMREKTAKGYAPQSTSVFDCDEDELNKVLVSQGNAAAGPWLNRQRIRGKVSQAPLNPLDRQTGRPMRPRPGVKPLADPVTVVVDPVEALNERIRTAMTQAAVATSGDERQAVMVEYTKLSSEVTDFLSKAQRMASYVEALEALIVY